MAWKRCWFAIRFAGTRERVFRFRSAAENRINSEKLARWRTVCRYVIASARDKHEACAARTRFAALTVKSVRQRSREHLQDWKAIGTSRYLLVKRRTSIPCNFPKEENARRQLRTANQMCKKSARARARDIARSGGRIGLEIQSRA